MLSHFFQFTDLLYECLIVPFINIDEFEWKLLRSLLIILLINLVFITIAWNKYGNKISERFMKPAASKILEDLKKEATELKLPKEHTPRI